MISQTAGDAKATAKRKAESWRKRYHMLKAAEMCVHCAKQKARPGKTLCLDCADAKAVASLRHATKCRAKKLCVACGESDCEKLKTGRVLCAVCTAKAARREKQLYAERKASGLCPRCGTKRGSFGYIHCARCREMLRAKVARWSSKATAQKGSPSAGSKPKPPTAPKPKLAAKPKKPAPPKSPKSKPAATPKSNSSNFDPNLKQARLANLAAERAAEKAHDRKLNAQWRQWVMGNYDFYGTSTAGSADAHSG